jgi:cyanophycin synthetase
MARYWRCCGRPARRPAHEPGREIRGEFVAIDTALSHLQPGDLCLILIDQVEEALDHIAKRVAGN